MARFESAALTVLCLTVCAHSLVPRKCLACICEAMSSCDAHASCSGGICGPFRITQPYWADGGKPTVNNELVSSPRAYTNCASDPHCSILAVQGYMKTYQQDCNGDGNVDCDDFAMIHKLGGFGCQGGTLKGIYAKRYLQCKGIVGA